MGLGVGVERVLDELAGVADDEEQRDAGEEAEEGGAVGRARPGAWGGYSLRRSGRLVEVAMGLLLAFFCGVSAYQAMFLSRPKRMMRPRAAARRMAQASVERWRNGRVLGVDM
jgi:hypothetical protein